jgi:hypothetical protein
MSIDMVKCETENAVVYLRCTMDMEKKNVVALKGSIIAEAER